MLRDDIVNYVKTYLAKGYSIQSIKNTLALAGYNISDINESIAAVYAVKNPKSQINKKALLTILLGIFLLGLIIFTVRKCTNIPEAEVEFKLIPEKMALQPDESLSFSYTISGQEKQKAATIIFKIVDYTNKKIVQLQENLTFKQSLTRQIIIQLPENLSTGQYILQAILGYNNNEIKTSFQFKVIPKGAGQELKLVLETKQEECTPKCDDQNICTEDTCLQGICQYKSIVPCCGNLRCETGEAPETCSDCKKQQTFTESMDSIIQQTALLARQKPEAAKTTCRDMPTTELSDRCFSAVAGVSFDATVCPLIFSEQERELCYADIAIETKQFTLCQSIKDRWLKNSCTTFQRLTETVQSGKK